MAEIKIEDPEVHKHAKVDQQGRVFIGSDYAGDRVTVTVEVNEKAEEKADA